MTGLAVPIGGGAYPLMGQISLVAMALGFPFALAEIFLISKGQSESRSLLIEFFALGLMLVLSGLILPGFSFLLSAGIAMLLVIWPASYCILFLTRKQERSLLRMLGTLMLGSYLLFGFLYVYL